MPAKTPSLRVSGAAYPTRVGVARGAGTSSAFSPLSLPGLYSWWDFTDFATLFTGAGVTPVTTDGDAVQWVHDKSGGGRHLKQATAGQRPTYRVNLFNGLTGLRFDGVDDVLAADVTWSIGSTGAIVTVLRRIGAGDADGRFWEISQPGNAGVFDNAGNFSYWSDQTPGGVHTGVADTTAAIISVNYESLSLAQIRVNGRLTVAAFNPSDDYPNGVRFNLGSLDPAGSNSTNMETPEVVVTTEPLSASNHNRLGMYFSSKYALPWTPVA